MSPEIIDRSEEAVEASILSATTLLETNNCEKDLDYNARKAKIANLIDDMRSVLSSDQSRRQEFTKRCIGLLLSDPLTDQQAGIIARWRSCWYEMNDDDGLTPDETLDMYSGDWQKIIDIVTRTENRRNRWLEAQPQEQKGAEMRTVYRGMYIRPEDALRIPHKGIVPQGLWRTSLDEIIGQKIDFLDVVKTDFAFWKSKRLLSMSNEEIKDYQIRAMSNSLLISKSTLLQNHWYRGPDMDDTYTLSSLAMSTTTRSVVGSRYNWYGNYIIEITLPADRLVSRFYERGMIDETVLYFIEPKIIQGVYPINGSSTKTVIEQIEDQK